MSGETNNSEGSHLYGFANRAGQDRHTQNIINHTSDLFPGHDFGSSYLPLTRNGEGSSRQPIANSVSHDQTENDHLDEFDRQLLGGRSNFSYGLHPVATTPRVSLPTSSVSSNRQPHVLGDASHHFRPFMPRSEVQRPSQFIDNPISLTQINSSASPATRSFVDRGGSHRISELQRGSQLATSPLYTTEPRRSSPLNSSLNSSSSPVGGSSPSTRLSLRKAEPRIAARASLPQLPSSSSRVALNLDHAPRNLTPKVAGSHLVNPQAALPDKCRAVFPYELFNAVQSKCFPDVYGSDDNVVVSAPTGSGKTAILEMAICKLVTTPGGENFKIVYQAPTKSLCSERARDWEKKFRHLNLGCVELTGDTSPGQVRRVGSASIIVTTPEKWDSITRKWADHHKLLDMVRLVLIDEVHILKDVRGATLEAVVSRMKTSGANVRFVALSATVPNLDDVAAWLGRDHKNQQQPARQHSFGEEMRPVKLKKHVYGYESSGNDYVFDKTLDGKLNMLLGQHSERKPIMVFCFTRKSCEQTAQKLAEWWTTLKAEDKPWPAPTEHVPVVNKELHDMVLYGVAFHHAGLDAQDRASVERNYLSGQLQVICCTSTLAVGVNLPCHTVVLKGTSTYDDEGLREYSDLEVMQILGRAGRPQFDRNATAIIMTKLGNVARYEKMISGQEVLESKLHLNLIEHLNSEIGLGTIRNLDTAKKWMTGTFLYVRMGKAPDHYRSKTAQADTERQLMLNEWIQTWCRRDIELLQKYSLVTNTVPFSCTEYGIAMSRYMIQFDTMKQLLAIPMATNIEQLLISLAQAAVFQDMRLKPQEKSILRTMNSSTLYPIRGPVSDLWHNIYLLVQISLTGLELPAEKEAVIAKRQMATDKSIVFDRMNRLVRCVIDCKVFDGDGISARSGLELTRAIAANSWEGHSAQLQQVQGLGPVTTRKLTAHGVNSIVDLSRLSFVDIERFVGRNPPYGKNLLKSLEGFPRLKMTADIMARNGKTDVKSEDSVTVTVKVQLGYENLKVPTWNGRIPAVTFLAETSGGRLANFWRGNIKKLNEADVFELKFIAALSHPDEHIACHFSCEEIVGTEVIKILSPNVPSSAFQGLRQQGSLSEPSIQPPRNLSVDIEEENIADEDMLSALDASNANAPDSNSRLPRLEDQSDALDAEFPDIEDFLDDALDDEMNDDLSYTPVQMENGKWMCNHHCAGGAPTKNGRPCTHKCCHEGLDKPRPPSRKKPKNAPCPAAGPSTQVSGDAGSISAGSSQRKGKLTGPLRSLSSALSHDGPQQPPKRGRTALPQTVGAVSVSRGSKRPRSQAASAANAREDAYHNKKQRADFQLDANDVEFIDLCTGTDDESKKPPAVHKRCASLDSVNRLNELHSRVQPKSITPSRLTKPYTSLISSCTGSHQHKLALEKTGSDYGSDVFGEEDEAFPQLAEFVRSTQETHKLKTSQKKRNIDETLCPDIFETYKERKDYASERFDLQTHNDDLAKDHGPDHPPATTDLDFKLSTDVFHGANTILDMDVREKEAEPLFFDSNPFDLAVNVQKPATPLPNPLATPLPGEPAWVGEFDEDLINMLRGSVEFID
ncbi:hypothetical protein SCAR479_03191 [Seiridium cardinale]|uniref:DNA 3'-5' helicase n=1 Tax=Seiridium cardinale TaxID=138064 RepID=A0ABR2Y2Q0_9PEZI